VRQLSPPDGPAGQGNPSRVRVRPLREPGSPTSPASRSQRRASAKAPTSSPPTFSPAPTAPREEQAATGRGCARLPAHCPRSSQTATRPDARSLRSGGRIADSSRRDAGPRRGYERPQAVGCGAPPRTPRLRRQHRNRHRHGNNGRIRHSALADYRVNHRSVGATLAGQRCLSVPGRGPRSGEPSSDDEGRLWLWTYARHRGPEVEATLRDQRD
jgi:hypothetical protein